jgi:hypothetical protein
MSLVRDVLPTLGCRDERSFVCESDDVLAGWTFAETDVGYTRIA